MLSRTNLAKSFYYNIAFRDKSCAVYRSLSVFRQLGLLRPQLLSGLNRLIGLICAMPERLAFE